MLHRRLTSLDHADRAAEPVLAIAPHLAKLDFLGRMPVPLRYDFTAGLDRAANAAGGRRICFVKGNEWYAPFDNLLRSKPAEGLPGMLLSPFTRDVLSVPFQERLRAGGHVAVTPRPVHPSAAGLKLLDGRRRF